MTFSVFKLILGGDVNYIAKSIDAGIDSRHTRRRITMEEDFDVVRNILYFIYTNRVTFSTLNIEENDGTPKVCDADDIYGSAHRLDLEDLKVKSLRFLKQTCNRMNITERVFSKFSLLYVEIDKIYSEFFQNHWPEIRETSEFAEYFEHLEVGSDLEETRRIFRRFRELMTRANF